MVPTVPSSLPRVSVAIYINSFTIYTIRNPFDILLTAVADVSKGQTDMPYQGAHQTLTEHSMRHQVCPSETCWKTISISAVPLLMFRGKGNCGMTYYVRIYPTY